MINFLEDFNIKTKNIDLTFEITEKIFKDILIKKLLHKQNNIDNIILTFKENKIFIDIYGLKIPLAPKVISIEVSDISLELRYPVLFLKGKFSCANNERGIANFVEKYIIKKLNNLPIDPFDKMVINNNIISIMLYNITYYAKFINNLEGLLNHTSLKLDSINRVLLFSLKSI